MSFTIANALRWWARECPDRVAIDFDDDAVTYAELHAWAGRVGDHLQQRGVKAGDRVCVVGVNSLAYAVLSVGLMRLGAIDAPLSFRSTARELRRSMATLEPVLSFADAERAAIVREALEGDEATLASLDEILALRSGEPIAVDRRPEPDDPVFVIGTSGSTGAPKGVVYTHRMVMTYAAEFALMEPLCASGSGVLLAGPFSSSSGTLILFQFLGLGASIYTDSQFTPERALARLSGHRITTFMAAPIFFERVAALEAFESADLSNLRFAQTAGARIAPSLLAAWRKKGVVLRHAYGCTEAGGAWAARDDIASTQPDKCGRGGVFTDYAIAAPDGGFAAPGEPGEILIRSACLTPGYWENADATAEAIRDGWLHTGDLGKIDDAGNLKFLDRLKDIIISGGLNVSAMEVEQVIAEVDGVEEVAIISAPDPNFGETPLAVVYGDRTRFSVATIISHANRELANFKVPRYVLIVDAPLPRLPSGKIAKVAIREAYKDAAQRLERVR